MSKERPLCFVLMPFGTKKDPTTQRTIDFDSVYEQGIRPAVEGAGMEAIRADEERTGGIIHKPMFERLLLCDFAVADLTMGNPNVYYELGVRHAARPSTTVSVFAEQQSLPFDLRYLRALPYHVSDKGRFGPNEANELATKLTRVLCELRELARDRPAVDSPLFQLLGEYRAPDISHLKTDVFRSQVDYSIDIKNRLRRARELGDAQAVAALQSELDLQAVEAGVLVDLFLTWRALSLWDAMIDLYQKLPSFLRETIMMREQLGFALNRAGRRNEALEVLESVLAQQGPSSETLGLVGRIYKDLWLDSKRGGQDRAAAGYLARAIESYVRGFEADWRDAYPGINAVTLLDIQGSEDSLRRKQELLPVVHFAVQQRLRGSKPSYWDHATLLELSVLENNEGEAMRSLSDALVSVRESWEPATTVNNLKLIQEARQARGTAAPWLGEAIEALEKRSSQP